MRHAYAAHRPVANAYLVRQRDRRRLRELGMVLLTLLPLGLGLMAYTWIQLEVLSAGYQIDDLEQNLDRSLRVERQLRLEASYLASPQRIEQRAIQELGMQAPDLEQMVFVDELP